MPRPLATVVAGCAYLQSSSGHVLGREAFVFEDGSLHVVCLLSETAAVFLTAAPDEWERPHKPG